MLQLSSCRVLVLLVLAICSQPVGLAPSVSARAGADRSSETALEANLWGYFGQRLQEPAAALTNLDAVDCELDDGKFLTSSAHHDRPGCRYGPAHGSCIRAQRASAGSKLPSFLMLCRLLC